MATLNKQAEQSLDDRLGYDLTMPINGAFQITKGLNMLLQDIQQLLLTIPGERVGRPDFGCNLRNQLWENIDTAAVAGKSSISTSLTKFEPRIQVNFVDYTMDRNADLITFIINFTILNTDIDVNLVFPYRTSSQISAG